MPSNQNTSLIGLGLLIFSLGLSMAWGNFYIAGGWHIDWITGFLDGIAWALIISSIRRPHA